MIFNLSGETIKSLTDFHEAFAKALDVPDFYGGNYSALWDVLTGFLSRPYKIVWNDSAASSKAMGKDFDRIVDLLKEASQADASCGADQKLEIVLL
jgi:ribonuclease inhibitor